MAYLSASGSGKIWNLLLFKLFRRENNKLKTKNYLIYSPQSKYKMIKDPLNTNRNNTKKP